jgi:aminoglycoside 2'-N-acetyltransferase I
VLAWDEDGVLVSTTGALTRAAIVDGHPTTIGGIGSVKTHPAVEGRGYATAGLRRATAFLTDEQGVAFSLLVCREPLVPFYRRLGWDVFGGTLLAEHAGATRPFTINVVMLIAGTQAAPTDGIIDLCGPPW